MTAVVTGRGEVATSIARAPPAMTWSCSNAPSAWGRTASLCAARCGSAAIRPDHHAHGSGQRGGRRRRTRGGRRRRRDQALRRRRAAQQDPRGPAPRRRPVVRRPRAAERAAHARPPQPCRSRSMASPSRSTIFSRVPVARHAHEPAGTLLNRQELLRSIWETAPTAIPAASTSTSGISARSSRRRRTIRA